MSAAASAPGGAGSKPTAPAVVRPPPPNAAQLGRAQELCSQLHYAYYARPPVADKKKYKRWYAIYYNTIYSLCVLLNECTFADLPLIAIAGVYLNNLRAKMKLANVDLETIHPEGTAAPNIEPPHGIRRLPYNPTNTGQVRLKPEDEVVDRWWRKLGRVNPAADAAPSQDPSALEPEQSVIPKQPQRTRDVPQTLPAVARRTGQPDAPQASSKPSPQTPGSAKVPLKSALKPPSAVQLPHGGASGSGPSREDASAEKVPASKTAPSESGRPKAKRPAPAAVDAENDPEEQHATKDKAAGKKSHKRARTQSPAPVAEKEDERGRSLNKAGQRRSTRSRSHPAPERPQPTDGVDTHAAKRKKTITPAEEGFPPQQFEKEWHMMVHPCERCKKVDNICLYWPLGGSVCQRCAATRLSCSNIIGGSPNNKMPTTGYLQWRFQMQLQDPEKFPAPKIVPTGWLGRSMVPQWFIDQYETYKKQRPPNPDYAALARVLATVAGRKKKAVASAASSSKLTAAESPAPAVQQSRTPGSATSRPEGQGSAQAAPPSEGPVDTDDKGYTEISDEEESTLAERPATDRNSVADAPPHNTTEERVDSDEPQQRSGPIIDLTADETTTVAQSSARAPDTAPMEVDQSPEDGAAVLDLHRFHAKELPIVPRRVEDTWRSLPILARPPAPSESAAPLADFRPATLADFMAMRLAGPVTDVPRRLLRTELGDPAVVEPPRTPPAQVFQLHAETKQLLYDSLVKTWAADSVKESSLIVAERMRQVIGRLEARHVSLSTGCSAASTVEAIQEVLVLTTGLIEDNKLVAVAIAAVADISHLLARSIEGATAISPQFGAAAEIIEVLLKLRSLYGEVQEKFSEVQQGMEPVWNKVQDLQDAVLETTASIETLPAACSGAVEPMLNSLQHSLQREMDTIRQSISGEVHTAISKLRDNPSAGAILLGDNHPDTSDILPMLADIRRRLKVLEDSLTTDSSSPNGDHVPALPEASSAASPSRSSSNLTSADGAHVGAATGDVQAAMEELSARMDRLELAKPAHDPVAFGEHVQQYLNTLGLTSPVVLTLSQIVGSYGDVRTDAQVQ